MVLTEGNLCFDFFNTVQIHIFLITMLSKRFYQVFIVDYTVISWKKLVSFKNNNLLFLVFSM
jgi:hypothetical protein